MISTWQQWKLNISCPYDCGRWSPKMAHQSPLSLMSICSSHQKVESASLRLSLGWPCGLLWPTECTEVMVTMPVLGLTFKRSGRLCFCALGGSQPTTMLESSLGSASHQRIRPHVESTKYVGEGTWHLPAQPSPAQPSPAQPSPAPPHPAPPSHQVNAAKRETRADDTWSKKTTQPSFLSSWSTEQGDIIYCCFKPLSFEVVCCTAIDNWINQYNHCNSYD